MLDSFLSAIAPHSCVSCARIGAIMCSACIGELAGSRNEECIGCGAPAGRDGMCVACRSHLPYDAAHVFTRRSGPVEELINDYKFARVREAYRPLATMVAPLLPRGREFIIVPVPTICRHVRRRGYDHAALLARRVARLNGNTYLPLLRRQTRTVQHGTDKATRRAQAAKAFYVHGRIDGTKTYIIVDDITTTGASLTACAAVLRAAGATTIIAAAVARQPLDDEG